MATIVVCWSASDVLAWWATVAVTRSGATSSGTESSVFNMPVDSSGSFIVVLGSHGASIVVVPGMVVSGVPASMWPFGCWVVAVVGLPSVGVVTATPAGTLPTGAVVVLPSSPHPATGA